MTAISRPVMSLVASTLCMIVLLLTALPLAKLLFKPTATLLEPIVQVIALRYGWLPARQRARALTVGY